MMKTFTRTSLAALLLGLVSQPALTALAELPGMRGTHHIAFYVDDMDKAVVYLETQGVEVLGAPKTFTEGPMEGLTWIYFMAPWSMQLEMVSVPHGMGYEADTGSRLWDPRH